jgi:hypothetical protein
MFYDHPGLVLSWKEIFLPEFLLPFLGFMMSTPFRLFCIASKPGMRLEWQSMGGGVTPSFKAKTRCITFMCARIKFHT